MSTSDETRYSQSVIKGFVRSQRNLAQGYHLSEEQVKDHSFFQGLPGFSGGPINLLYFFTDGEGDQPALCFQNVLARQTDEESEMYRLVWIDPSIRNNWEREILSQQTDQ